MTPWTVAHKAPLSMGFSRQEDWSGLSFPAPGDLSDPGMEPRSPMLQTDSLPSEPPLSLGEILYEGWGSDCEMWALISHRTFNTQESSKALGSWVKWGTWRKENSLIHVVTFPDFPL